ALRPEVRADAHGLHLARVGQQDRDFVEDEQRERGEKAVGGRPRDGEVAARRERHRLGDLEARLHGRVYVKRLAGCVRRPYRTTRSSTRSAEPWRMPSAWAAASESSTRKPSLTGPRSLTRTSTRFSVAG